MANHLFQQAKDAMQRVTTGSNYTEADKQAASKAVQAAYAQATPEEQRELQQLEVHLSDEAALD